MKDKLIIAGKEFSSRLMMGTGKFESLKTMKESIEASGTEIATVALRRIDISKPSEDILSYINRENIHLLPNTAGAATADEAILMARLSMEAGLGNWLKLEIEPNPRHHLPDGEETLKAAKILIKEGFVVLPYISADPILAKKLEDIGCATVMPLGSPIGSHHGILTKNAIQMIIEDSNIPVVVDAGLGAPSHAAEAMEMGADAVLVNTAIATANDPKEMAIAFALSVKAGRKAFKVGIHKPKSPSASSPIDGKIEF